MAGSAFQPHYRCHYGLNDEPLPGGSECYWNSTSNISILPYLKSRYIWSCKIVFLGAKKLLDYGTGRQPLLSDVMFDPDIDTSSVPWSDLSLSPTEDALFADVYLGMDEDALTSFTSWDFLTMQPPPTTNPPTATFASPDNGESSECIETQASLPRLQTHISSDMLSPQTHEVPPTQSTPERPANVGNTTKRTKMKHGTRPCDLKRQKRKVDKPEKCHVCQKGHQWRRDLERHYCTHHPNEAAGMGFSMSRPVCRYCGQDFARRDHLTRHLRRKHGG